jgi:ABC-type phosphate transport system substrate-binding protein
MRRAGMIMLAWLALAAKAWGGELYVVVNATNPVQSLSRSDVIALFTGRARTFPDGGLATPYDHAGKSDARASFYRALTGMELARVNSYWSRLLFTGQVQPPPALANDAAVVARILAEPKALGYLTRPPVQAGLRVVYVVPDPEADGKR